MRIYWNTLIWPLSLGHKPAFNSFGTSKFVLSFRPSHETYVVVLVAATACNCHVNPWTSKEEI